MGLNKFMKELVELKKEIAEDDAAKLKALAMKRAANAKGFARRAAEAKAKLAGSLSQAEKAALAAN